MTANTYARILIAALCLLQNSDNLAENQDPVCFYVNSYHQGNAWSDGIERGLRTSLAHKCEIVQLDMDTLNHPSVQDAELAGRAAYEMMKVVKPDVVIASDDNAAKYFIVPYARKSTVGESTPDEGTVPVVFAGINWTTREYDFPDTNVTGIIEVAPVKQMLLEGQRIAGRSRNTGNRIAYLGAITLSEKKNYNRVREIAQELGFVVDGILVDDFAAWQHGFALAQDYDLIVIGSNASIEGWNNRSAADTASRLSRTLSMTSHQWMMPYALLGYTNVAEEQGEWAAATVLAILNGSRISDIPVVRNRRWDIWINEVLRSNTQIELSDALLRSAKKFH